MFVCLSFHCVDGEGGHADQGGRGPDAESLLQSAFRADVGEGDATKHFSVKKRGFQ